MALGPDAADAERPGQGTDDRAHARRPLISFGDALSAAHQLKPRDTATAWSMMQMLGLAAEQTAPAPVNIGAAKPSSTDRIGAAKPRRESSERKLGAATPKAIRRPASGSPSPLSSLVTRVSEAATTIRPPTWLDDVEDIGPLSEPTETPQTTPLFGRVHRRGILSAAMATLASEGELDVDAIVETLAAGRPLLEFARLERQTTRRGAQVLLDRSRGMAPFREDQKQLVDALDHILGDDHFKVERFVGCPSRGLLPAHSTRGLVSRMLDRDQPIWRPPPPGTPIVAITDLGIGGSPLDDERATVAEWVSFAHRVRNAGFTLVGLVPYEASRSASTPR